MDILSQAIGTSVSFDLYRYTVPTNDLSDFVMGSEYENYKLCTIVSFFMAIIFIVDSLFYFFALLSNVDNSRVRTSVHQHNDERLVLRSRLDFYFVATLLFFIGSIFYLLSALDALHGNKGAHTSYITSSKILNVLICTYINIHVLNYTAIWTSFWNLIASFIFLIDSPMYLLSGWQERSECDEVHFLNRRYVYLTYIYSLSCFDRYANCYI